VIGKKLTELRTKKGMTQVEAAKKLKMPRSTYSNYELDKREPDFDTAEKIANLFDITVDDLLGREKKESPIEETEIERIIRETNEVLKTAKNVEQAQLMLDLAKNVFKK
jgi:transcriptional regulator with XRE-family HTH domain